MIVLVLTVLATLGLAVGCRSGAPVASGSSLVGTSWRALEIDGRGVLERVASTLSFESAKRIAGQAACNRDFGDLEMGEGTIRLRPTGTTALGAARTFRRERDDLLLLDDSGRVQVRLAPAGSGRTGIAPPPGEGDGRGAELRATGNEPVWVLELFGDRIVFVGDYGARRLTMARPPRQVGVATGEEVYVGVTQTERKTVRISPRPCVDTMSGDRYGTTVEVELDDILR